MMHHLILGYGYCGYYLAQELLRANQRVTVISRHLKQEMSLPELNHIKHDLNQPLHWTEPDTIIYYLIPPPSHGERDLFLENLLKQSTLSAKKIIYFGSSGVYGDHQGAWVTEESPCFINNSRQQRRLDAEQQWMTFSKQKSIDCILLRVAGIYGPNRLPIEAARAKTPIVARDEATVTNHIFVKDLASIAYSLAQASKTFSIYNIADGDPNPMGTLQELVTKHLHLEPAPYETWAQAFAKASPMKQEFMQGSKRLNIQRLKSTLSLYLTPLEDGVIKSL